MTYDVLITGSLIFTGSETITGGYVYIKSGIVKDLGSGTPPEDLTYASLILGGPRRAIMPSLIGVFDPIGYPFRASRGIDRCRISRLGGEELFKLSLPLVYEAHMAGYGDVILLAPNAELPITLSQRVGGGYGYVPLPECGVKVTAPLEGLTVALDSIEPVKGQVMMSPARDTARLEDPYEASRGLAGSLGLEEPSIRVGSKARIAVYNLSKPPVFTVGRDVDPRIIYGLAGQVESLLYGDTILVDTGEHLWIVERHLREAYRIAEKEVENIS